MNPAPRWRTAAGPNAEPLAGLRVSFGAVASGALAALATALLLWGLALAIVLTAARAAGATTSSLRASLLAIWISTMATVIVGAFCGGALAGSLPGNRSRAIAAIHAFLSWALAFLISAFGQLMTLAWLTRREVPPDTRGLLTALGYSPQEATALLSSLNRELQSALHGDWAGARPRGAAEALLDGAAAMAWAYYGTWLVALLFAIGGGIAAVSRRRRRDADELVPAPGEHAAYVRPEPPTLTPAH